MYAFRILIFLLFCDFSTEAIAQTRPEIGLCLSGGGAKGLAHIGVLQALDSAGLQIDYLTGTSMGAVVGSLYAAGYNGKELEAIAKSIDWELFLSNTSPLNLVSMEEKSEYGQYVIELPIINKRPQLPSGILKGQELWTTMSELFMPIYDSEDFYEMPIPFKCVAADVVTGKAVVMDCGDITKAVRASMAIPMVFTAVDIDDKRLVDGGVIRNFPVRDVQEMGADYVIGSSVSYGSLPKEELNNIMDIILQIIFLRESEDYIAEIPLCDYFINMPVQQFNLSSFAESDKIIQMSVDYGKHRLYPHFKHLKDSLDAIYGVAPYKNRKPERIDSLHIESIEIKGLEKINPQFFIDLIDFEPNRFYAPSQLSEMVRMAAGTRFFKEIVYELQPTGKGSNKIIYTVVENANQHIKFGAHYASFTGLSALMNYTTNDFLSKNSRTFFKVNVGENFRIRAEHLQYLGLHKNIAFIPRIEFDILDFSTFSNFEQDGLNRSERLRSEFRIQRVQQRTYSSGLGIRYESGNFSPTIQSQLDVSGRNSMFSLFGYSSINSTDRQYFPNKGVKLDAEGGWVFAQNPTLNFKIGDQDVMNPDSLEISYENFARFQFSLSANTKTSKSTVLSYGLQTGINFNNKINILNDFRLGGLQRMFPNQLTFGGLEESTIVTASAAVANLSLRYTLSPNFYLIGGTNVGIYDFLKTNFGIVSGYTLALAYNSPLGVLSITGNYCDQSRNFGFNVNLGFPFY